MTSLASKQPAGLAGQGNSDPTIAALDDTELVKTIRRGGKDALAEAYRRHGASVYGLACRLVGSSVAEGVTEEVFLRLWHTPGAFDPTGGSLRPHLLAEAHARAVALLRNKSSARGRRRGRTPRPPGQATGLDVDLQATPGVADEGIRSALAALSEAARQAISLTYFGGCTYRQVAARLHQPQETVKTDIRAGLSHLRENLFTGRLASHQTSQALDSARQAAGLTHGELWLRYFTLGGMSNALQVEAFCYGALQPSDHDYDVIVHAVNERFAELGDDRRVAYSDDEARGRSHD